MTSALPATRRNLWAGAGPFVLLGTAAIIAGGLISAVTALAPTRDSAWAVAYLVLVVGVAQIGLGLAQGWCAGRGPGVQVLATEFLTFNLGNAAVILGTLWSLPALVDAGGAALVVGLAFFLAAVRGPGPRGPVLAVYRILIVILLVSIPVGLVLAQLRAG